jgi:hypothetical protein
MNSLMPELATEPLLFSWDPPRRRKAAIAAFLALSLVAHAFCFYIFQIVYPPTVTLLPPPARVTLITPASEEGRTLLRWIDAEDPALAFATHRPPEATLRALPKAEHVPSYLAMELTLKDVPTLEVDLRIPDSHPAGAVPFLRRKTASVIGPATTSVSFSNDLDTFGAPTLPEPRFVASNRETPETTRFRVAVSSLGEIRYCLPLNSSGDPALDEQARLYLARCRFSRSTAGAGKPDPFLIWGIATIEWGTDVARPQPASITGATP